MTMRPPTLKGSSTTLVELVRHNMHAKPTIVALPALNDSHKSAPKMATAATVAAGFQGTVLNQTEFSEQNVDILYPYSYNTYSGRTRAQNHHSKERSAKDTGSGPKRTSSLGRQSTAPSHAMASNYIRRAGRVRLDLGRLTKFGGVATKAAVNLFHFRKHRPEINRPTTDVAEPPIPTSAGNDMDDQVDGLSQQSPLDCTRYCRPPVFEAQPQPKKYPTIQLFNKNATMYPPQFQDVEDVSDSSTVYNSGEEDDSFRIVEIKKTGSMFRCMPQLVNIVRFGDGYSIVPAAQRPADSTKVAK
ncbi:hypothetical protein EV175_005020 [Coemansia sp. RSA 1933]|nr:hypothetical protein EV175_005020 [Coemansia sp. RSA 1933]